MNISQYNSMMAIKRHPEFKENYNAYNKLKNSNKRLQKAFEIKKKWGYEVERIINIEKIKNLKPDCVKQTFGIYEKPMQIISIRSGDEVIKREVSGERLYLKVDIYATTDDLMKAFKGIISEYKEVLPKDKRRNKGTREVNIWDAYDMHTIDNLDISQITQKLIDSKKKDLYVSNPYQAVYNAVKRGIAKAEKNIRQVKKT